MFYLKRVNDEFLKIKKEKKAKSKDPKKFKMAEDRGNMNASGGICRFNQSGITCDEQSTSNNGFCRTHFLITSLQSRLQHLDSELSLSIVALVLTIQKRRSGDRSAQQVIDRITTQHPQLNELVDEIENQFDSL